MARPHLHIASPAAAGANNGNWQTASRWRRFLARDFRVTVGPSWHAGDAAPDLLIALHARRSSAALDAFHAACPDRPTLLVLTGTDLYRDIHADDAGGAAARTALDQARALVLLQPRGLDALPAALRTKAHVIYQSAQALRRRPAPHATRDIAMIGHLRAEKDPLTFMRAAALMNVPDLRLLHIGAALDPALGAAARDTEATTPAYRWLGALPHLATLRRLRRCHALVLASVMEGGANVIIEAVTRGVPVLASGIAGNVGMLGADYAGYFDVGDAAALARLIERSVADAAFYADLRRQCAARARLFTPHAERARLRELVDNLLSRAPGAAPTSRTD